MLVPAMNKLALCIATAILAATARSQPPDDGPGTTDTGGDRADGDGFPVILRDESFGPPWSDF